MKLFDFQMEDAKKLYKAHNGLNGNEMGTGKTVEAIQIDKWWARAKVNPEKWPTLVIAPINTFDGWVDRFKDLDPDADVVVVERTPSGRAKFAEAIRTGKGDVFLCNYESARILYAQLVKLVYNSIILDECHRIANRKSQTTKAIQGLGKRARHRLALSGTASGDKPENLWTILNWLWPKVFTSYWNFRNRYCVEESEIKYVKGKDGKVREVSYKKIVGYENLDELHRLMNPWYVRHLKRERCCDEHPNGVMEQLPAKTYNKIWVDLNATQRRIYEQMRKEMVAWVGEHEDSPLVASVVVAQLVRLSQIALATPEVREEKVIDRDGKPKLVTKVRLTLPSSKLEALLELVKDNPDKKFVVFKSTWESTMLDPSSYQEILPPVRGKAWSKGSWRLRLQSYSFSYPSLRLEAKVSMACSTRRIQLSFWIATPGRSRTNRQRTVYIAKVRKTPSRSSTS
jgi:SNF2 family DNA or RNA helicase